MANNQSNNNNSSSSNMMINSKKVENEKNIDNRIEFENSTNLKEEIETKIIKIKQDNGNNGSNNDNNNNDGHDEDYENKNDEKIKMKKKKQVLIIGGGISGLSTGLNLIEKKCFDVMIIEARDRIGGRIDSHLLSDDQNTLIDTGASFIHGIDGNPLVDLIEQYNQPIFFEDDKNHVPIKVYTSEGQVLDEDLGISLYEQAQESFFNTAREFSQMKLLPTEMDDDEEKDNGGSGIETMKSLYDYLIVNSNRSSPLFEKHPIEYHSVLREFVNSLDSWTGASSESISLRWWGFEKEFGGEDGVLKNTYYRLVQEMTKKYLELGGRLLLGRECQKIRLDDQTGKVRVTTVDSSCAQNHFEITPVEDDLIGDCCVCTVPLGVLKEMAQKMFEPALPPRRLLAIDRTGFGLLNKVIVRYEEAWWPKDTNWFLLLPDEGIDSGSESEEASQDDDDDDDDDSSSKRSSTESWPSPNSLLKPSASDPMLNKSLETDARLEEEEEIERKVFSKGIKVQNYYPINSQPILVFYLGGELGESIEKISDERVKELIHSKLIQQILPSCNDLDDLKSINLPLECIVTRWRQDRYSRGSYSFMKTSNHSFDSNSNSNTNTNTNHPLDQQDLTDSNPIDILEMSKPLWNGRLGFAGEHCSINHFACVHGPYLTGLSESNRIYHNHHKFNNLKKQQDSSSE